MNVAVFVPNWIGDAVMATPAFTALRQHFAADRLFGVVRPYVAGVLEGGTWFDELIPLPPAWVRGTWRTARDLRARQIDLAVLFTNSFRTALAARLGGCRERVGYARDGRAWLLTTRLKPHRDAIGRFVPSPVIDAYNALATAVGAPSPGYQQRLFTTSQDEANANQLWKKWGLVSHRPVILLNPGAAYGAAKLWPKESFARLARWLTDDLQAQVLVLCGPAERELARGIAQAANRRPVYSLADEAVSLGLLKACVKRADLLITTDSGPRHFAAAFNKPVVTLFGPTHIAWTETYHPLAVHLQHQVPCGPCQQRICPEGHHRCMTELSVDEVFQAAAGLLERAASRTRALPLAPRPELPLKKGA